MRIVIYLSLLIFFISCKNQSEIDLKKENSTSEILNQLKKQPEIFTFNKDSIYKIIGKEGTIISIPSNCFVNQDGTGPGEKITIELLECYSPSDIIFHNLTTQTSKDLLQTEGMVFLKATSDSNVLKINDNKNIQITFPNKGQINSDMKLFKGEETSGYLVWKKDPISDLSMITTDTIYSEGGTTPVYQKELDNYLFNSKEMGWLNCDRIFEGKDRTIFTLNVDTSIIPNVRLMFPNLKLAAFAQLEGNKFHFYNIPIGEPATLITFYRSEGVNYLYKKDFVIQANMTDTPIFRVMSLQELKTEIDQIKWKESI